MDVLDGQVARLSNTVSKRGAVLDSTLDRYADFFLLAGIAFYFRSTPLPFILALLSIHGSFMISYSTAKAEAIHIAPPIQAMRREKRWIWILVAALVSAIFKYEPVMVAALLVVAVVSNCAAAMRLYAVWKKAL
jgi:phosphatidylglycerophosphate synthase